MSNTLSNILYCPVAYVAVESGKVILVCDSSIIALPTDFITVWVLTVSMVVISDLR